jgi:hypothetical protein
MYKLLFNPNGTIKTTYVNTNRGIQCLIIVELNSYGYSLKGIQRRLRKRKFKFTSGLRACLGIALENNHLQWKLFNKPILPKSGIYI